MNDETEFKQAYDLGYIAFLHDHAAEENPYTDDAMKMSWLNGYMGAWMNDQDEMA
jgi:ribosome modulation factor